MPGSVVVAGARTPIGKLSGALAGFTAMDLGGLAITAALERAGVKPTDVDYVFMGQVLQAGQGQITARQAAVKAGIPMTVPATTINKVCLSGLNALYLADLLIQAGDAEIIVAGGMESMTAAPYLLPGARAGYRAGDQKVVDSMMYDGLFDAFDHVAMGAGTEGYTGKAAISRERQDAFAATSHERAAAAIKDGRFADEIVPVNVPQRKGDPVVFDTDEGVRPETTVESLAKLKPAFDPQGTITAGNASQNLRRWRGCHRDLASQGGAARHHPARRARRLRPSRRPGHVAVDAAFAGHPECRRTLGPHARRRRPVRDQRGIRRSRCGVRSTTSRSPTRSSTSTGAPSPSVTRSACRAPGWRSPCSHELKRRGGGVGAVALCGGGGQGDAALLRTID